MLLVAAVVAASASDFDAEVDHHWEMFKRNFPKPEHLTEESVRKELFRKVHHMITEHNKGGHSYTMAHNQFSDMHKHEKEAYMGLRLPENFKAPVWTASNGLESSAPASLDWRSSSCLQPVKNQGGCGSCWAFSAIGSLEFAACAKYGYPMNLSEQQLVDCDPYDGGCGGGWYYDAWKYLQSYGSNGGSDYPYTAQQGSCRYNSGAVRAYPSGYSQISANPSSIINALQSGPVSIAVNAVDSFMSYSSGVYVSNSCGGYPNHAIMTVGYGNEGGYDYWIVRNSWGSSWGQGGYAYVYRGADMCCSESYVYQVHA